MSRPHTRLRALAALAAAAVAAVAQSSPAGYDFEREVVAQQHPYPAQEDVRILKLYEGLRVADVSDAMDLVGLMGSGLVSAEIKPLWRDLDDFSHRIQGIAMTARYQRTNRPIPRLSPEEYDQWRGKWYATLSKEHFVPLIRPGMVLVIEASEDGDSGTIGSNNTMNWKLKGLRGVVSSGGARDTDEIMKEKVPVYTARITRGYPPGRNELESVNRPVTVGGVLVHPGDVVVADGDGVVVVPRRYAEPVAAWARKILDDKQSRRGLYDKLGLPPDKSVLPD